MINLSSEYIDSLKNFNYVDLFCGIGGFKLALDSFGANCVYSIDIDKYASKVYELNHGINPLGDITKVDINAIPKHDILTAGFPCQAFSISGKQEGFKDKRGTLFFDLLQIIQCHHPKIILLENVSHLKRHDNGRTYKIIKSSLRKEGYTVYDKVLNASKYGIPQARKRIYLVCFRNDLKHKEYTFPNQLSKMTTLDDVLLDNSECEDFVVDKIPNLYQNVIDNMPYNTQKPIRVGIVNKGGQGDRIYSSKGHSITLSASSGGTGSKTGLYLVDNVVRKLHPRETARLMGFPDLFVFDESVSRAHKQFGNSVVVDVLQYILIEVVNSLRFKNRENKVSTFNKQIIPSEKASNIARQGLLNEDYVINIFNDFKSNNLAQEWLKKMNYNFDSLKSIEIDKLVGFKSDITMKLINDTSFSVENIQIKLISNSSGYNQIDKRWISQYVDMWDIPYNTALVLKYFTGELKPFRSNTKDTRRMFLNEFNPYIQSNILSFFNDHKSIILNDILKGLREHKPNWLLIIRKKYQDSLIIPMDDIIAHHLENDSFYITKNGNLRIGPITLQRKGGDGGRITSNMLQFKLNPSYYFKIFK